MGQIAAITVYRAREEVERLWRSPGYGSEYIDDSNASVAFAPAPGDRGTEILVELEDSGRGGKLGEVVGAVVGSEPLAKLKDELRRFKQLVETGEIARSDATPEGEQVARKLEQRPAQPLAEHETEKAGA
jgi:uncharacterized membrane protein